MKLSRQKFLVFHMPDNDGWIVLSEGRKTVYPSMESISMMSRISSSLSKHPVKFATVSIAQ